MKSLSLIISRLFKRKEEYPEIKVLKKYMKGRVIDEEDRQYIDRLASVGFMRTGYSPKHDRLTARTLAFGEDYISPSL